jgi:hypothetical protein
MYEHYSDIHSIALHIASFVLDSKCLEVVWHCGWRMGHVFATRSFGVNHLSFHWIVHLEDIQRGDKVWRLAELQMQHRRNWLAHLHCLKLLTLASD